MQNNIVVIYHGKCQDGAASAFPFRCLNPVFIGQIHPVFYNRFQHDVLTQISKHTSVYSVDFAPAGVYGSDDPMYAMYRIAEHAASLKVLDHHGTEEKKYKECQKLPLNETNVTYDFNTAMCGAMLVDQFVEKNPDVFGPNVERVDKALLYLFDLADRNVMKDEDDCHRVCYLDEHFPYKNLFRAFDWISAFNRLSDGQKQIHMEKMLREGRCLYNKLLPEVEQLFRNIRPSTVPSGLNGYGGLPLFLIEEDSRTPRGRITSKKACEFAEREGGIVLLRCKRDGLINISIRTGKGINAGIFAQYMKSFSILNSGGGGDQVACYQRFAYETSVLFPNQGNGTEVAGAEAADDGYERLIVPPASIIAPYPHSRQVWDGYCL